MTEQSLSAVDNSPRIGSLCSGYGGLDLGLMAVVGGSVAWHVEYDKHPSAVLDARFPGVPNYGDLTSTDWTQLEPVDWLTAGYPCQPFSHAGKRRGSKDERHLWPFVADAIGTLRPRRVLLENVAGHVSLGLDAVLWDLAALGYDATWGVVRAADAGAPHNRARIFILAADATRDRAADESACSDIGLSPVGSLAGTSGGGGAGDHAAGDHVLGRGAALLAEAPADADSERHERAGSARGRRGRPSDCGDPAANAQERAGHEEHNAGARCTPGGAARLQGTPGGSDHAAADTDSSGLGFGTELDGDPAQDPADRDSCGEHADGLAGAAGWGQFEPAIRRWAAITGRPAPAPTIRARGAERLSPYFVEWMMGLPDGWVTAVLPRNPALKALGNGVVPQQAALALTALLSLSERQVAA